MEKNIDVFVPNIFSPNGDNINDRLLISTGPEIEEIESFQVFDRWGNMMYSASHFPPNDPGFAWDGKWKGERLNPAVYAYRLIVKFKDGRQEMRMGDVTLLR